ncbi:DinB family protein [Flavitalea flava]
MSPNKLLILHFEEIRRRSMLLWEAVPSDFYTWLPDKDAMTILEMVRHVLESEHLYLVILNREGLIGNYISPWANMPYTTLSAEIEFAIQYREGFLAAIQGFKPEELEGLEIVRQDVGQKSNLGKYLLKIAYHEAVHGGQFLSYLRILGIDRPLIWG